MTGYQTTWSNGRAPVPDYGETIEEAIANLRKTFAAAAPKVEPHIRAFGIFPETYQARFTEDELLRAVLYAFKQGEAFTDYARRRAERLAAALLSGDARARRNARRELRRMAKKGRP